MMYCLAPSGYGLQLAAPPRTGAKIFSGPSTARYSDKNGLFSKFDSRAPLNLNLYVFELQSHMVTLWKDVDGPRGS
jgi:hypothetical protein